MNRIHWNQHDTGPMVREMRAAMTSAPFISVGDRRTASGRQFTAVKAEPYERRDGGESQLVTWRGQCATCEAPYEIKGSRNAAHLPINCEKHRGRRTRHSKRRQELRSAIAAIDGAIKLLGMGRTSAALELLLAERKSGGA